MGMQPADLFKTIRSADLAKLSDPRLLREFAYIGGEWTGNANGRTFAVTDPATDAWLAGVPALGADDACRAVDAAEAAFPAWSGLLAQERSAALKRWYDLIVAAAEDLALIMTL